MKVIERFIDRELDMSGLAVRARIRAEQDAVLACLRGCLPIMGLCIEDGAAAFVTMPHGASQDVFTLKLPALDYPFDMQAKLDAMPDMVRVRQGPRLIYVDLDGFVRMTDALQFRVVGERLIDDYLDHIERVKREGDPGGHIGMLEACRAELIDHWEER